jgi:hypothetical protein
MEPVFGPFAAGTAGETGKSGNSHILWLFD